MSWLSTWFRRSKPAASQYLIESVVAAVRKHALRAFAEALVPELIREPLADTIAAAMRAELEARL